MSYLRPLREVLQASTSPESLLSPLLDGEKSKSNGMKLVKTASSYGLSLRDYLMLAVKPSASPEPRRYEGLNGYEAALCFLNIPLRNDFEQKILLQLASDTFHTYDGTRIMFPEVIDDMMRWVSDIQNYENSRDIVFNSRTISGNEMISYVLDPDNTTDAAKEDTYRTSTLTEGGRVPVRQIRTSEHSVRMWKYGWGYETTYEFQRRAALELLAPFAARTARMLEISKVRAATQMLITGDSVFSPAPVVKQSDFGGTQDGTIQWKPLLRFLVSRAKAMMPVDTSLGNWDSYFEWLMLFAQPELRESTATSAVTDGKSPADKLSSVGMKLSGRIPLTDMGVNFALSGNMPNGQMLFFRKQETLEELIEAGSMIAETEQIMSNQTVSYIRTMNLGYRLATGDTRVIYDYETP